MVAPIRSRSETAIRDAIVSIFSRIYLPRARLNAWQWCEANIILDPEESRDNHGPYNSLETIYVRRVFEFITRPEETELIIMKSAQLGFTLAYMLIICYLAATAPTHVLYAMHSAKKAKEISLRLRRIFTRNRALADTLLENPDETLQNLLLKLKGMHIVLTGSGSAGEFDAASFGFVALDELDRHERGAKQAANTIDLARSRIKEVASGKLLAGGTPETAQHETYQNYLTGTREELHLPCPRCGFYQPLDFERLRYDHCKNERSEWDYSRIHSETYLLCANAPADPSAPHAGACLSPRIKNTDKRGMLRPECIRWVVTNHGQDENKPFPGRASLSINDMYSTRANNTWGHIAAKFVDAQKSPSKLRQFYNQVLGRPRVDRAIHLTARSVAALAGGYEHGCTPIMPANNANTGLHAIILYADQQATCLKWVKAAFSESGECWVIDYDTCLVRDDLLAIADRPVVVGLHHPSPEEMHAAEAEALATHRPLIEVLRARHPDLTWIDGATMVVGGIDEGNGTDTVDTRAWCLSTADPVTGIPRFFPTKGADARSLSDLVVARENRFFVDGRPITVYHYCDDDVKTELYVGRIAGHADIAAGRSSVPALHLPANPTTAFLEELSQEARDELIIKGKKVTRWIDPRGTNDYGDALKCCLVMWHTVKAAFASVPAPAASAVPAALPPADSAGYEMDEHGRIRPFLTS